jgi:hypothetical protein
MSYAGMTLVVISNVFESVIFVWQSDFTGTIYAQGEASCP